MCGLLPQIFSSTFPDDFHAKEFLTGILRVVEARNGRAHQQSHFIESDALTAMSQMIQVLRLCESIVAADNINMILNEAKVLVDTARTSGTAMSTSTSTSTNTKTHVVRLDAREYTAQLVYLSINNFCVHIDSEVGTHFCQDRGIEFGKDLDPKWTAFIKSQKENFKTIAELRHWYFHHVDGDSNISAALKAMEVVVTAIATVPTTSALSVSPWKRSPTITTNTTTPITIILNPPTNRMSIPVAREHILVGRETAVIDTVTTVAGKSVHSCAHPWLTRRWQGYCRNRGGTQQKRATTWWVTGVVASEFRLGVSSTPHRHFSHSPTFCWKRMWDRRIGMFGEDFHVSSRIW